MDNEFFLEAIAFFYNPSPGIYLVFLLISCRNKGNLTRRERSITGGNAG